MTTMTTAQNRAQTTAGIMPIIGAAATGIFLIYFAGFAQATVFHDSAHDTRHTLAFPCH
jgi:cobalt transporter subunit CbtB